MKIQTIEIISDKNQANSNLANHNLCEKNFKNEEREKKRKKQWNKQTKGKQMNSRKTKTVIQTKCQMNKKSQKTDQKWQSL